MPRGILRKMSSFRTDDDEAQRVLHFTCWHIRRRRLCQRKSFSKHVINLIPTKSSLRPRQNFSDCFNFCFDILKFTNLSHRNKKLSSIKIFTFHNFFYGFEMAWESSDFCLDETCQNRRNWKINWNPRLSNAQYASRNGKIKCYVKSNVSRCPHHISISDQ